VIRSDGEEINNECLVLDQQVLTLYDFSLCDPHWCFSVVSSCHSNKKHHGESHLNVLVDASNLPRTRGKCYKMIMSVFQSMASVLYYRERSDLSTDS